MSPVTPAPQVRTTLKALAIALALFAVLSYLRVRVQTAFALPPAVGLTLSFLMYFIPGWVLGLLVGRAPARAGALLGLLTVAVVWLEVPLQLGALAFSDVVIALLAFAGLGVLGCTAGSAAAAYGRNRRRAAPGTADSSGGEPS
jgi:hypothetical protein